MITHKTKVKTILKKINKLLKIPFIKDYFGKFRVKFLSFENRTAEDNSLTCINILKQYFPINQMDITSLMNSQLCEITQSEATSQLERLSINKETYTHKEMALV